MENPTPDFLPLTPRQLELLEAIKAEKEKLKTLPPCDPKTWTWVPEFYEIHKRIDDLSVKALRSGLLRGFPADSRRPGFRFVFDSHGEYAKVLPGFGDFHPDLPPWAVKHFFDWIQMLRLRRHDARDILRETGIISIETGIKSPIDFEDIERWELIKHRVLELRGARDEEDGDMISAIANDPPPDPSAEIHEDVGLIPYTLAEMQEEELRNRMRVTPEMLKVAKRQYKARSEKKRKRTRRNSATWDMVIDKLVEEKLLTRKISPQAFKKSLKKHLPDTPWDEV